MASSAELVVLSEALSVVVAVSRLVRQHHQGIGQIALAFVDVVANWSGIAGSGCPRWAHGR